jgi:hypothetical protein
MKTDVEIARETTPRPIVDVARELGLLHEKGKTRSTRGFLSASRRFPVPYPTMPSCAGGPVIS